MDIAALSVILSQGKVQNQASISVMKMVMDKATEQSNTMVDMTSEIALSVNPDLGSNLDVKA